jgi:hypothetical protein
MDSATATAHGVREVGVPRGRNGWALERHPRRRSEVIVRAEAPRDHAKAGHEAVGNVHACPVEVAVVREARPDLAESREEEAERGLGLTFGADELRRAGAQAIGGRGDNRRVLADEDGPAGGQYERELFTQELPAAQAIGLPGIGRDPEVFPAVSDAVAGGLGMSHLTQFTREMLRLSPIGADVVEYNPLRDPESNALAQLRPFLSEVAQWLG